MRLWPVWLSLLDSLSLGAGPRNRAQRSCRPRTQSRMPGPAWGRHPDHCSAGAGRPNHLDTYRVCISGMSLGLKWQSISRQSYGLGSSATDSRSAAIARVNRSPAGPAPGAPATTRTRSAARAHPGGPTLATPITAIGRAGDRGTALHRDARRRPRPARPEEGTDRVTVSDRPSSSAVSAAIPVGRCLSMAAVRTPGTTSSPAPGGAVPVWLVAPPHLAALSGAE